MSEKITPYQALRTKFPEQEYVLIKEVADSSSKRRRLDFMAINLWESRGLAINGIEVKSYRGDWLNELRNPAKQELHLPYCDYFYLFTTDEKVAKLEEIPENWGWMTLRDGKVFTLKKAPKLTQVEHLPKPLIIAMIRRAADKSEFIHRDSIKEEVEQKVESKMAYRSADNERQLERYKQQYEELKEKVEAFESEFGVRFPTSSWGIEYPKELGNKLKFLLRNDIDVYFKKFASLKSLSEDLVEKLDQSIKEYNILNNQNI